MKLVEIKDVRVGQIWKDKDGDLWLEWNDIYAPPIRDTKYYRCDKETFKYLVECRHKLVGFLGITHEVKDFKLSEIIPAYKNQKVQRDDIVKVVADNSAPWLVDTTYNSHKYKDYISLLSPYDKDFTEDEIEKIGTLGVNYEFVHDRLKNPEDFNTSDGNVKRDNK